MPPSAISSAAWMPAIPPPMTSAAAVHLVSFGRAARVNGTPYTAQAAMALARSVAPSPLTPCSRNDASLTSSGSRPASDMARVNAGLKKPGESPAITILSRSEATISSASASGSRRGSRPRERTTSTCGRFAT